MSCKKIQSRLSKTILKRSTWGTPLKPKPYMNSSQPEIQTTDNRITPLHSHQDTKLHIVKFIWVNSTVPWRMMTKKRHRPTTHRQRLRESWDFRISQWREKLRSENSGEFLSYTSELTLKRRHISWDQNLQTRAGYLEKVLDVPSCRQLVALLHLLRAAC